MDSVSSTAAQSQTATNRSIVTFAYLGLLIAIPISGFWRGLVSTDTTTLLLLQSGVLAILFALTFAWNAIRSLRGFFVIAVAMSLLPSLVRSIVVESSIGISLFGNAGFLISQTGELISKLISILGMIGLLLLIGLKRDDFFLVRGDLNAVTKRTRLFPGMKTDDTWRRAGRNISITVFVLLLTGTLVINLPRLGFDNLIKALPLVPLALLFAAVNGIYEEVVFRAAPMSQLVNTVGSQHALLITIIYFGMGHFFGSVPSGVMGVAIASYFAFIMGKAMLETRGIVWPWVCHFAADSAVFIFMAVSAVAAGTT